MSLVWDLPIKNGGCSACPGDLSAPMCMHVKFIVEGEDMVYLHNKTLLSKQAQCADAR